MIRPNDTAARLAAALALLAAAPTFAAAAPQGPPPPGVPVAPRPPVRAQVPSAYTYTVSKSLAWLDQKIDIDINNQSVGDAVRKVVEASKVGYDRTETEFNLPKDRKVSVKAKDVAARDALAAVARLVGAVALVSEKDGKMTVTLRPRSVSVASPMMITQGHDGAAMSLDIQRSVQRAMEEANKASSLAQNVYIRNFSSRTLPDRRVKLDARGVEVREALKDVLKQANLDYALEEDVPDDIKKSFTFENVPIATALDVVCESAGVGWVAERSGGPRVTFFNSVVGAAPGGGAKTDEKAEKAEKKEAAEEKIVVRIGKKYAPKPGRRTSGLFDTHGAPHFLAPSAAETLFDHTIRVPAVVAPPAAPILTPASPPAAIL